MNRFWENAAGILETATGASNGPGSDLAIVVDSQNCLRIVYGSEWGIDALQREYQASAAYTVKRTAGTVTVEARSGAERCTLRKSLGVSLQAVLGSSSVPRHLMIGGAPRLLN